jgi:hypothetical protein
VSIPVAAEKKLLTPEDFEAVKVTHHPAISDLSLESLKSAKHDLGERREKLRAILVEGRRARVRRTTRDASAKGDEAQVGRRKQVFAKALRRVNHELHRREEVEARARHAPADSRPEPKPRKAVAKASASAPSPKEAAPARPARGRAAKAEPGEARGGAKGRKASKKEG